MKALRFLALLAVVLICGCATVANYQANLKTWVGQSEQNLQTSWGAPASITQNGNITEFTYVQNDGEYVNGGYGRRWATPLYCTTTFSVQNGIVIGAQFQGNECKSY